MTDPAAPPPRRRLHVPPKLLLRFLILPVLLVAAFALFRFTPISGYLSVEAVTALFDRLRQAWWAPVALIGAHTLLLPVGIPATPLVVAGAAVFGPAWGTLYNFVGIFLGGALTFYVGRLLGRDFVAHFAGQRLKKVERTLARRGFWSLVGIRFLPLPYTVLNYTAALAGVRPGLFLATTAIGMLPTIAIYTLLYATLTRAATGQRPGFALYAQVAGALLLLILATAVPQVLAGRKRKARYRKLCEARRGRAGERLTGAAFPALPI
jgi:uncharacterized membrane protein YdjX (TVP38/TMEM64 family)